MSLGSLPTRRARDVPLATAAQMAEADRIASDGLGIPLDTLMESASRQIATATQRFFGDISGRDIVALAGKGNNGGDALGALPLLREAGAVVEAYSIAPREDLTILSGIRHDALTKAGIAVRETAALDDRGIIRRLERADILIDGILGYGTKRAARGEAARLIVLATAAGTLPKIVAVDVPSGLEPDHGTLPLDPAAAIMRAALTVTLAVAKPGLVAKAARPYVGTLMVADIGIPAEAFARLGIDTRNLFARGDLVRVVF